MATASSVPAGAGGPAASAAEAERRGRRAWSYTYALWIVGSLLFAAIAARTVPSPFSVAFLVFVAIVVLAVVRPRLAIYPIVFFAVLGDPVTSAWYPFTKDLSSAESILFISNQIKFTPLEVCLAALTFGWILQMAARRNFKVVKGRLFGPMMIFALFVVFGLAHGLTSGGGNTQAALWEVRAVLYLPLGYVLLMNLVDRAEQYVRLYALVMLAVFINSILALINLAQLSEEQRKSMESFIAHGATLPMNTMLVLLAASWLFKNTSGIRRAVLPFALIPVVYVYLVSERRAAFVALLGAIIVLGVFMFWTKRQTFWKVAPVVLVLLGAYTAAFWNNEHASIGFPAQAIKSVISPSEVSDRNQDSDLYRIIEKNDIVATIRSSPILGIGFGHAFLRPIPLPPINQFLLAPYMPHNAVLWMWMKVGAFGFLAMVYLFGLTMVTGVRNTLRLPPGDYAAITLTSLAFVLMYAIFSYVDISWDAQNMIVLAMAMAQIASAPRLAGVQLTKSDAVAPGDATSSTEPELAPAALALHRA
jgi:hypothetical protein